MVENYPLTISRTAKERPAPLVATKTPVTVQSSGSGAKQAQSAGGLGGEGADLENSKEPSKGRSRFYFESDALALKNNPE